MSMEESYDHSAIIDDAKLGNEPSVDYLEHMSVLDRAVRECMSVSQRYAGISSPTGKHYYASVLFTALVTRAVSLISLAPHSLWATKLIEHWDYASATGIVRTMMELRFTFHYLCVDECSEAEWECRWHVFNLHDCVTRRRLLEAYGNKEEEVAGLVSQAGELCDRLKANAYFTSMPEKQQRRFMQGQTAFLFHLEDIAERAGVDKSTFRWLYILLSSHVHAVPFSFYRIGSGDGGRGRGLPSRIEENYTSLCLSLAASYLVHTRDELHVLFTGLVRSGRQENTETVEKKIEGSLEASDALPVGKSIDLVTTTDVRVAITRTSSSSWDSLYYFNRTNEVVLERSDAENEGASLKWFDPVFWNVVVNGSPATEGMLAELDGKRWAFKVDTDTRTVKIKFEP